jgi:disulfide bond formation protein DsbB
MTPATVQLFYGLLAIVGVAIIGVVVVWRGLATVSTGAAGGYASMARAIGPMAYGLTWFVALLATMGSLYFSEVAGYTPCVLCWYQRIAMYPLVVILAVAAARRDVGGRWYAIALAGIGALIAAYHVALEWIPSLDSGACDAAAPCTYIWFRVFGVISLPTLALIAFGLILTILLIRPARDGDDLDPEDGHAAIPAPDPDPRRTP